jgi:putative ATP-binding cassette transporter
MTPDQASPQEIALSRQTAVRLGRAIRNFASSEVGGRAAALAGVLLTLLLAINGLNVVNSYVGRYFMTAVEQRNGPEFARQATARGPTPR